MGEVLLFQGHYPLCGLPLGAALPAPNPEALLTIGLSLESLSPGARRAFSRNVLAVWERQVGCSGRCACPLGPPLWRRRRAAVHPPTCK